MDYLVFDTVVLLLATPPCKMAPEGSAAELRSAQCTRLCRAMRRKRVWDARPPGGSHGAAGCELSAGESTVCINTEQASSNRNTPETGLHVTRTDESVATRGSQEPDSFLPLASVVW